MRLSFEECKLAALYGYYRYGAMTDAQAQALLTDNGLMDYFEEAAARAELYEENLLADSEAGLKVITRKGREALGFFINRLPRAAVDALEAVYGEYSVRIRAEQELPAGIEKLGDDQYRVTLYAMENGVELMQLRLNVPTRELAGMLERNWRKASGEIFSYVFKQLSDRDDNE